MSLVKKYVETNNIEGLRAFMIENDLILDGNRLVSRDDAVRKRLKAEAELANQRQQARKILLNSLN